MVGSDPVLAGVALSDREAALAEFEDYLRTVNSREGRPYEEKRSAATSDRPRTWTAG